jgi:hypothetical protein
VHIKGSGSELTFNERYDALVMLLGGLLLNEIDLILKDDDILELHNFHGGEMLGCLRLRAGLVASDEKESGVHDGSAVKHGGHENAVAGAVDEGDMPEGIVGGNGDAEHASRTVIASCGDHNLFARIADDLPYPTCRSGSTPAVDTLRFRICKSAALEYVVHASS